MARATMNISLPQHMRDFIESEVARGGYGSTSEYIRALVREAQERLRASGRETVDDMMARVSRSAR